MTILQSTVLAYRMPFYRFLREQLGSGLKVYCGAKNTGAQQVTDPEAWAFATEVANHYLMGKCFLWQAGVIHRLLRDPLVVVDANFRTLSTVCLVLLRRITRRKTVAWSHAEGRSRMGNWLRYYYFKFLYDGIVAYTDSQRERLKQAYPGKPVWSACNACLSARDCYADSAQIDELTDFVFVGRLSKRKKPDLLLEAFAEAKVKGDLPEEARLIFVGDGEERNALEDQAVDLSMGKAVVFTGWVNEVSQLRSIYRRACASVSPGYAGLSVTQSCGFGVPVLVARDEPHSPEIEVCREGETALFFASDDTGALVDCLKKSYDERAFWLSRREEIAATTRKAYSFEHMADVFLKVASHYAQ